jgi:hypothetical protein
LRKYFLNTKMKKLHFFIIGMVLFFGTQKAVSQTYKFITTGFSVLEKEKSGSWGKWSNLEKASLIITLDTNKNRIVVYSQEIQLYEIVSYAEKEENENDLIYSFACEDSDKLPFTISIITRKNQNNRKQLYINQKNVIVVYNIENYFNKDEK